MANSPSAAGPATPPPAPVDNAIQGTVEVDSHFDDDSSDSGVESGLTTATTSIASSVFEFQYANGRRYASDRFKKADYYMPNDEHEQDRLDMYHHIFLMTLSGQLYTAPLVNPQSALDVGTGTGIWAMDFADQHPEAKVIANDISPIQPTWVPQNLTFEVDDVEEEWMHAPSSFDYIHLRSLSGSIQNWPDLLQNAYIALAPGGYIEYQDYGCEGFLPDGTHLDDVHPQPPVGVWFSSTSAAATKMGRPLRVAREMKTMLESAGFVNVTEKKLLWPLSTWPKDRNLKEIGAWVLQGCVATVYPFAVMLLKREGWTDEEIKKMCDDAVFDLTKGKKKYYGEAWFVVGQKPLD